MQATEGFLDLRGRWPRLVYPLSADRFQDRDTDNADDRCRTIYGQKIIDDSATVSNIHDVSHSSNATVDSSWQRIVEEERRRKYSGEHLPGNISEMKAALNYAQEGIQRRRKRNISGPSWKKRRKRHRVSMLRTARSRLENP